MRAKLPFSFKQCAAAALSLGSMLLAVACSSEQPQQAELPAVAQMSEELQLGATCSIANDLCTDANTHCALIPGTGPRCVCEDGFNNEADPLLCVANTTCEGVTCGVAGATACDDSTGVAICTCAGNQNNYADPLVCVADLTCPGTSGCTANGACDATAAGAIAEVGILECICNAGWTGATCNTCATGFINDTTVPGADCLECAPGYHDADTTVVGNQCVIDTCVATGPNDDNPAAPACVALQGTCEDEDADGDPVAPFCECETGYTGATCNTCVTGYTNGADPGNCDACAAGYHDGDTVTAGNQCVANVGCAGVSCTNGTCDVETGTCECPNGFNNVANPLVCVTDVTCPGTDPCTDANEECDDSTGVIVCVCEDDFNDVVTPGTCVADTTCAGAGAVGCGVGNDGDCVDTTGVPVCTCDPGYNNVASPLVCVADVTCVSNSCSGRGTCEDETGVIVCDCDGNWGGAICAACATGYDGDDCDECADGYNDVADEGTCVADVACAVDSCSGNGECEDETGVPVCTCTEGYEGDACDECADGFTADGGLCVEPVVVEAGTDSGTGAADAGDAGEEEAGVTDDIVIDDLTDTEETTVEEEAGATDTEETDTEETTVEEEAGVTDTDTEETDTDVTETEEEAGVTDTDTEETDTEETDTEETDTEETDTEETDTEETDTEETDTEETDTEETEVVADAGGDAGLAPGGGSDDGCDCSVVGKETGSSAPKGAWLVGLLGLAALLRRRQSARA